MRKVAAFTAVIVGLVCLPSFAQAPAQPPPSTVTEISADLGPCAVEFKVTDLAGNGLYNAKIHTLIRYGFMSKRKLELEAGTNADGRARFTHLPSSIKKPILFDIRYADQTASYSFDPATNCEVSYTVPLDVKAAEKKSK
jgi:hypothetical protein